MSTRFVFICHVGLFLYNAYTLYIMSNALSKYNVPMVYTDGIILYHVTKNLFLQYLLIVAWIAIESGKEYW